MPNKKTDTIPVYGSAKQIVEDLHKMATNKGRTLGQGPTLPKQKPGVKPKFELKLPYVAKKATLPPLPVIPTNTHSGSERNPQNKLLIFALIIAALTITYLLFNRSKLLQTLQANNLSIPSETDKQSQDQIKSITSMDWQTFADRKKDGSTNEKLTALLLLYSEETTTFKLFSFVDRSKDITAEEISTLAYQKLDETPTQENIVKAIEYSIKTHELYEKKGVDESKIHIQRLKILGDYFSKYEMLETDQIPQGVDQITAGVRVAENHQEFAALLLKRFNIFFRTVNIS